MSSTFDYPIFQQELISITEQVFLKIQHKDICGFALYSDDDAGTICLCYQTREHLLKSVEEDNEEDPLYYKWYFGEWFGDAQDDEPLFNELSKKLFAVEYTDEESFVLHKTKIFNIAVDTLLHLKNKGLFDQLEEDFVLLFDVSDFDGEELQKKWVETLNNETLAKEYLSWMS